MRMAKSRRDFERALIYAFERGMISGYGVDHEDIHNSERMAINEYMRECAFSYSYSDLFPEPDKGEVLK
jgi:hypothetical protein